MHLHMRSLSHAKEPLAVGPRFSSMPEVRVLATYGRGDSQVLKPRGMCAMPDGTAIICDSERRRLLRLFVDGRAVEVIPVSAFSGLFDKSEPYNIDVDPASGDLLLVEVGNHRALRLRGGKIVWKFGGHGREGSCLDSPRDIKLLPDGRAVVADCGNHRLLLVDAKDGRGVGSVVLAGNSVQHPTGLAVDGAGLIYISDSGNHRVLVTDDEGTIHKVLGTLGSGPGQLNGPEGLAVSPDGSVFVADGGNNRVVAFFSDGRCECVVTPSRPTFLLLLPPALVVACHKEIVCFPTLLSA
jgi:tripartite motif-containing protein 71